MTANERYSPDANDMLPAELAHLKIRSATNKDRKINLTSGFVIGAALPSNERKVLALAVKPSREFLRNAKLLSYWSEMNRDDE
ncbi:MAG: hypothetical protein M3R69_13525 [Acidobacteriota bacterium]|nr:hypothetical protein [Acidobacteriota bacterium]